MPSFLRDSRHAFRAFRRQPTFVLTAILTIALGMGVNTALYTLIHAVMSRPLPVENAEALYNVYVKVEGGSSPRSVFGSASYVSFPDFQAFRSGSQTADIGALANAEMSWTVDPNRTAYAQLVSDNILPLIGAKPVLGRFFTESETSHPGSDPVVILSHSVWQNYFGGKADIVGQTMILNRTPFTIIGVADEKAVGPEIRRADIWIPVTMQGITRPGESLVEQATTSWIQMFARSKPGASRSAVKTEMNALAERVMTAGDTARHASGIVVTASFFNLPEFNAQLVPVLAVIWAAVLMILFVACANVANMQLARGLSRQREIAIRLAVGADRWRLITQMLVESAWLGVIGGVTGLGLAYGLGKIVIGMMPLPWTIQIDLSPDRSILLFTGIASFLAGIAFGLLPALQSTRIDFSPGLKNDAMVVAGKPRSRIQQTLIGVQVAISVLLLINAGLVLKSLRTAMHLDVGRPLHHLVLFQPNLRQQLYTAEQAESFHRRLMDDLSRSPMVEAAGVSLLTPETSRAQGIASVIDSSRSDIRPSSAAFDEVGPGYFGAAGLKILAGRSFTDKEARDNAKVLVVDQRFVDQMLHGNPLGRQVRLGDEKWGRSDVYTVVGVVNSTTPLAPGSEVLPTYFSPIQGQRYLEAKVWVRYRGEVAPVIAQADTFAKRIDPLVVLSATTVEQDVRLALTPLRMTSIALAALGGLALTLATVGLFGVIAFLVGRRYREIAIRIAMGAESSEIVKFVVKQGATPILVGITVGTLLAVGTGFLARAMFYGMSPLDPIVIGGVLLAIGIAALIAFWLPTRRATGMAPASVLRVDG